MRLLVLILALALSGCASTKDFVTRHPVITTVALTSAAFIAVELTKGHNSHSGTPDYTAPPDFTIGPPLTPDCAKFPEMCK